MTATGPAPRSTRQKRALADLLASRSEFGSAQELHSQLRARGDGVGLTTVYANLRALADAGQVDTLRTDEGEVLYRRCESDAHHHHLVCRGCGRTVEVDGPEQWADSVAAAHGFTDVRHTVEITGTCASCAAGNASRPRTNDSI